MFLLVGVFSHDEVDALVTALLADLEPAVIEAQQHIKKVYSKYMKTWVLNSIFAFLDRWFFLYMRIALEMVVLASVVYFFVIA